METGRRIPPARVVLTHRGRHPLARGVEDPVLEEPETLFALRRDTHELASRLQRELEDRTAAIAALEKRLALKRAALAATARFANGLASNLPLELVLRDQLHQCCADLDLPGGMVVLDRDGGEPVTWTFGEDDLEWAAHDACRHTRTAPETIEEGNVCHCQRTALAPVAWQGRRLGHLMLRVPQGGSAEDVKESAQALAAQVAQTVVLFESFDRIRRQEERYRQIFDSALIGLYQSTPDGRCIAVNAADARYLGFESPEELIEAMNTGVYTAYGDPSVRAELMRRLEAEGIVENIEIEAVRRDGTRVWLTQSARAVRDDSGRVVHIDGIVQNIDERKRAQAALAAAQRRLDDILSTSPAMSFVLSFDADGSVRPQWVSESTRQITGYTAAESCSYEWWPSNVHPDDRHTALARMEALHRTGRVLQEYRFRHRDGSYRWIRDEQKVARALDNGTVEVVGCWIDITEQKKAEEARRESDRLYHAMVQNTPIGVGRCDADWRILEVNPALARMLGRRADRMLVRRGESSRRRIDRSSAVGRGRARRARPLPGRETLCP
jgi:PAS domain S-box-containing protein